jgi:hypothetical protein
MCMCRTYVGRLSLLSDTDARFIDPDTPTACRHQMTFIGQARRHPIPPTPLPPSPEALKGEASNFTAPSTYSAWGSFCGDRLHIVISRSFVSGPHNTHNSQSASSLLGLTNRTDRDRVRYPRGEGMEKGVAGDQICQRPSEGGLFFIFSPSAKAPAAWRCSPRSFAPRRA